MTICLFRHFKKCPLAKKDKRNSENGHFHRYKNCNLHYNAQMLFFFHLKMVIFTGVKLVMYCINAKKLKSHALNSDLSAGQYIKQPNRKCNRLCVGKRCCDPQAVCSCGIHTGKYECVCPEGYYGNGLKGGCQGNLQSNLKASYVKSYKRNRIW